MEHLLFLFLIPWTLAKILLGIKRVEADNSLMGYLFRWLRIVVASPFLAAGLLLGTFGVHGVFLDGGTPYVPAFLFFGFLSLALGVALFPKKGLFHRDRKGS